MAGAGTVENITYGGNFLLIKCPSFSLFYRDFQWQTDRHSTVFKPEWDLLSVSLLHWTASTLCGLCVLAWSLRIPETPVSSCCSPHLAAVVFPYSARPKSLFQGCCSLTQEVDLASACSRCLEILSLVFVRAAAMVYFLLQVCPCRILWMIQPFPCNV